MSCRSFASASNADGDSDGDGSKAGDEGNNGDGAGDKKKQGPKFPDVRLSNVDSDPLGLLARAIGEYFGILVGNARITDEVIPA